VFGSLDTRLGETTAQLGGYIKHSSFVALIIEVLIAIFFSGQAGTRGLDDAAGREHNETKSILHGKVVSAADIV